MLTLLLGIARHASTVTMFLRLATSSLLKGWKKREWSGDCNLRA